MVFAVRPQSPIAPNGTTTTSKTGRFGSISRSSCSRFGRSSMLQTSSSRIPGRFRTIRANRWAWVAGVATIVSLVGYIAQTVLDHVSTPAIVGQLVFYGVFAGFGIGGLLVGIVAI